MAPRVVTGIFFEITSNAHDQGEEQKKANIIGIL